MSSLVDLKLSFVADFPSNLSASRVKRLTILEGSAECHFYGSLPSLQELSLLNADSNSSKHTFGRLPNIRSIFFFLHQDRSKGGDRFGKIIKDPSLPLPNWFVKGTNSLRKTLKNIYFVTIMSTKQSTEEQECFVEEISNKRGKKKVWGVPIIFYTFYCAQEMRRVFFTKIATS